MKHKTFNAMHGMKLKPSMVQYTSGGMSNKCVDGSFPDRKSLFAETVKERQAALKLPLDPVHPDTMMLKLPPVFKIDELISGTDLFVKNTVIPHKVTIAVKEEIFIESDAVNNNWHNLELLYTLPFVCGFVDHLNPDLQLWRKK